MPLLPDIADTMSFSPGHFRCLRYCRHRYTITPLFGEMISIDATPCHAFAATYYFDMPPDDELPAGYASTLFRH